MRGIFVPYQNNPLLIAKCLSIAHVLQQRVRIHEIFIKIASGTCSDDWQNHVRFLLRLHDALGAQVKQRLPYLFTTPTPWMIDRESEPPVVDINAERRDLLAIDFEHYSKLGWREVADSPI
jgi:hypothetical protein